VRLYKLDANNNVYFWEITQLGKNYTISWGLEGTDSPQTETINCPTIDRATFEVQSRTNEQIKRRGYSVEIPKSQPDLPMLAQEWSDHKDKVQRGSRDCFTTTAIQPKLDGFRCLANASVIVSRRKERITSVPHIQQILSELPPEIKLDGELYIHNVPLQTLQTYVRRNQPHKLHRLVEYHVFDIVNTELFFAERHELLTEVFNLLQSKFNDYVESVRSIPSTYGVTRDLTFPIKLVPTQFIDTDCQHPKTQHIVKQQFRHYRKLGYEGLIIRNPASYYDLNRRSPNLLKYKETLDDEFEIVDVVEVSRGHGLFVCKTEEGRIFECNPAWTHERKKALVKKREEYIGRWLHVKFEKYSLNGIPLKPVGGTTTATKTELK
jgi:DNA ligase 1